MNRRQDRIPIETQYQQEYESWRQHDRFIWQMPSVVISVAVAAIVASWAVEAIPWVVREFIIFSALILAVVIFFTLIKHRFFIDIEQLTLLSMEKEYAKKCIQRLSDPEDKEYKNKSLNKDNFWDTKDPNWFQEKSAHRVFKLGVYLLCLILVALLIVNPMLEKGINTLWLLGLVWGIYAVVVAISSFFLSKNKCL